MKVDIKDAPHSQKEIAVELEFEKFEKAVDEECSRVAKDAKIPGFRPGKAPKDVVLKHNTHKIRNSALDAVISAAVGEILLENNINPLGEPETHNVMLEDGKPITFTLFVDVFPTFTVKNYSDHSFDKVNIKVSEKDVQNTVEKLQEQYTEFLPVAKKRKAKMGDMAVIDYEGKVNDVPFDGGKAEGHSLELGSGQFIPGFEDGVVGMQADETKDITVKFPEQYHSAELAGKDAVFTVKLNELREKVKPEVDDDLAQKVSPEFKTLDALRQAIGKDLQGDADEIVKLTTFTKILDKLIEVNEFDAPRSIVREQAYRMAEQNLQYYQSMGVDPAMFGLSIDSIAERLYPQSEIQAKRALVINRIADDHKLDVSGEDVEKEITRLADITGRNIDELRQTFLSSPQQEASLKNEILSDKVYEFLCGANKFEETTISREEYEKQELEKREAARNKNSSATVTENTENETETASDDADEEKPAKAAAKKTTTKKADEEKPAAAKKAATAKKEPAKAASTKKTAKKADEDK